MGDTEPQPDISDCLPSARKIGRFFETENKKENSLESPNICDVAHESMTQEEGGDAVADKRIVLPEAKDAMGGVEEAEDS